MAIGETVAALTNRQAEIIKQSTRRTNSLILLGVIWSFIYTAVSLFIMFGMSTQTHETCEQFSASREAVRALILTDPDFDSIKVDELNVVLPPIEC
jgi:hypothetical protein